MSISMGNVDSCKIDMNEDFMIVFIGKELFYSNQTLRSVQNEFGVAAHRFENLGAFLSEARNAAQSGKIVVIDQIMMDDLLARPSEYAQAAMSGCLAFAYRKEEAARLVFEKWDRSRYGAIGFLPMNVAPDAWRAILRLLMHEELYLPGFVANCVNSKPCIAQSAPSRGDVIPKDANQLLSKLTRREKQVLQLVSEGKSNKTIAAKLGITEHTVKLHMHNVSGKIGVNNRTAAAHFFFEAAAHDAHRRSSD